MRTKPGYSGYDLGQKPAGFFWCKLTLTHRTLSALRGGILTLTDPRKTVKKSGYDRGGLSSRKEEGVT